MSTETEPRPEKPLPNEPYYRGSQTRRWGGLLLLLGIIWLAFELFSRGSIFGFGLGFVERSQNISAQSFAASEVTIRGLSDNIELVRGDGSAVMVEAVKHGFGWNAGAAESALDRIDLQISQRGNTLSIEVVRKGGVIGFVSNTPYADLRIALPANVRVDAQTISGELSAKDLAGDVSLGTTSGEIKVSDTAGNLKISTTSGDINLDDHSGALTVSSTSGDVDLSGAIEQPNIKTVSGDIVLHGARGDLTINTISGEIEVVDAQSTRLTIESTSGDVGFAGSLSGEGDSRISNISGDVRLNLADVNDLRLEIATTSGEIESSLALNSEQQDRRGLSGQVGDGTIVLHITTTSGDVQVDEG